MGIGTLRRHYRQTSGVAKTAPEAARPVIEQAKGNEELERLKAANASLIEQARHWKGEAVALGYEPPKSDKADEQAEQGQPDGDEAEADAKVEPTEPEQPAGDTPARSAKTVDWVEYAEANPTDPPLDLEPRAGLRDEIAAHYLGEV